MRVTRHFFSGLDIAGICDARRQSQPRSQRAAASIAGPTIGVPSGRSQRRGRNERSGADLRNVRLAAFGAVAELVGIEGGVVSGVINLESSGVEASDWRPRHDEPYHEA